MGRLILVSNRLPVAPRRLEAQKVLVPSPGGLVAGLGPVHAAGDGLWIGNFDPNDAQRFQDELARQRLIPVDLTPEDAARHYEGYSNRVLWPLCHYLLEHVEFTGPDYEAYARVNERFADVVAAHAQPDDTIWVHDYHLMLLPALLRQRLPRACIGFFLHIPFPSSEVFRLLPRKEDILSGLLGAHVIGLHTYDYARHLISTFRRVLAVEFDDDWLRQSDGQCRVGVFPLGVDMARHQALAHDPGVRRRMERLRRQVQGRKVILGVDRMDYTKGLPLRLDAFAQLLSRNRLWREKVVLFQLAVPSRSTIESYRQLKQDVEQRVGQINGAYQTDGLTPIQYLYRSMPADELAALYRLADVALITPIRDGMNLVAKEYVASRPDDSGVLILSEFAGAAAEMGEAILVNPYDAAGTAQALECALSMPADEIAHRMHALKKRIGVNTVQHWVENFLKALQAFAHLPPQPHARSRAARTLDGTPWVDRSCDAFALAPRALVALDYDGSLTPLVSSPEAAAPTADIVTLLQRMGRLPGVEVVLISGRDPQTLTRWFEGVPIHLIAEHGFHLRWRNSRGWEPGMEAGRATDWDLTWKDPVRLILEEYTQRAPGAFIEEKPVSLVWHYRMAEHGFGQWLARELALHLKESFAHSSLVVLHGHKVVEIRPQGFDKGKAMLQVQKHVGPCDFILAAGDDRTDEDMFAVLPSYAWTLKIGAMDHHTHARYRLQSPALLRQLLGRLVKRRVVTTPAHTSPPLILTPSRPHP